MSDFKFWLPTHAIRHTIADALTAASFAQQTLAKKRACELNVKHTFVVSLAFLTVP